MSNQEEVYVITPYQVSEAIAEGKKKSIIIICKDTGVFVLLWHCFGLKNLEKDLSMPTSRKGKTSYH